MHKPKAEIKLHNGSPSLFVDGKVLAPFAFSAGEHYDGKFLADFANLGVRIILFTTNTKFWLGHGKYNFSELDEILFNIVKANPHALIIPRIFLMPPDWWIKDNPSELRLAEDGSPHKGTPDECLCVGPLPSIASEKWRNDTRDFLETLIIHVEAIPISDHVIGYHISGKQSEEWLYWGGPEVDYNETNQESFRSWLREKYKYIKTLRKAWKNEKIDFDGIVIPTTEERRSPDSGEFFSPEARQNVIDFYEYCHWKIADTIRYFAKTVKEKTNRRLLVSVFYGYQLQEIPGGQLDSGHYCLRELLGSRDIDVFCSPTCYAGREPGSGYSYFMSLAGSVKLHGKLWFDENDMHPHVNVPDNEGFGKIKTLEDTISVQYRQFGNALCNSAGSLWTDQPGGWFNYKALLGEIAKLYKCGKHSVDFDLTGVAEIAVIIDEKSVFLRGRRAKFQSFQNVVDIGHIGAPVDFILLEDLADARPYKVYFFKYCYRTGREILKMLNSKVKRDGNWCLWLDHPGFFNQDDKILSLENSEPLTGLRISEHGEVVQNEDADLSAKIGRPAKNFDSWASVYFKDHPGADELRKICREAGVHLYLETGDAVYANRSFLCIHVNEGGKKRIKLLKKTDVYDIRTQKQIAENIWEFSMEAKPCSTSIFFTGKAGKWTR